MSVCLTCRPGLRSLPGMVLSHGYCRPHELELLKQENMITRLESVELVGWQLIMPLRWLLSFLRSLPGRVARSFDARALFLTLMLTNSVLGSARVLFCQPIEGEATGTWRRHHRQSSNPIVRAESTRGTVHTTVPYRDLLLSMERQTNPRELRVSSPEGTSRSGAWRPELPGNTDGGEQVNYGQLAAPSMLADFAGRVKVVRGADEGPIGPLTKKSGVTPDPGVVCVAQNAEAR